MESLPGRPTVHDMDVCRGDGLADWTIFLVSYRHCDMKLILP